MGEKILEKHQCRVLVNWGKPLPFWTGKKFVKREALGDFPALFFVSESRVFLMTEYTTGRVYVGIIVPIIPVTRKKHRILYMELALDKIEENPGTKRKFAYFKGNTLYFKPHGQLGRTKIVFQGLPKKFKKEIDETLQKARALNLSAPDAGILITDRPIREVYEERIRIINAQRQKTLKLTLTQEEMVKPESAEITMPTIKYESMMETEPIFQENHATKEKSKTKPTRLLQKESPKKPTVEHAKLQTAEPILEGKPQQMEKIETDFYSESREQHIENLERLQKTWQSLAPRETICTYCKKRVLTIDRKCPHCGAINL